MFDYLIQGAPGTPGDDIWKRASEEVLPLYIFYKITAVKDMEKKNQYALFAVFYYLVNAHSCFCFDLEFCLEIFV